MLHCSVSQPDLRGARRDVCSSLCLQSATEFFRHEPYNEHDMCVYRALLQCVGHFEWWLCHMCMWWRLGGESFTMGLRVGCRVNTSRRVMAPPCSMS